MKTPLFLTSMTFLGVESNCLYSDVILILPLEKGVNVWVDRLNTPTTMPELTSKVPSEVAGSSGESCVKFKGIEPPRSRLSIVFPPTTVRMRAKAGFHGSDA